MSMERSEVETQASLAYAKIMDALRALPWQVREDTCSMLLYNSEFCWHCGMNTPNGKTCHCQNDE